MKDWLTLGWCCCVSYMLGDKNYGVAMLVFVVGVVVLWLFTPATRTENSWRNDPPTDKQMSFATELGIDYPPDITKGELSDMITEAKGR